MPDKSHDEILSTKQKFKWLIDIPKNDCKIIKTK